MDRQITELFLKIEKIKNVHCFSLTACLNLRQWRFHLRLYAFTLDWKLERA